MGLPDMPVRISPTAVRKCAIVTTSWDDGQRTDFRMMELLSAFGIKGTFFVPLSLEGRPTPLAQALSDLPHECEIGSHTVTHTDLRCLDDRRLRYEVEASKAQLEARSGTPVRVFAYPIGRHDCSCCARQCRKPDTFPQGSHRSTAWAMRPMLIARPSHCPRIRCPV